MKALIIKELRERMPVLIIGLILGICPALVIFIYSLSHPSDIALHNLGTVVCLLEYLALAIFYTMFITGTTFAGEVERKNISFLFSLPLSRIRIWCVKFMACLISMGLIIGVFLLVNSGFLELDKILKSYRDGFTLILIVLPLLVLAISIFSSAISSRETASSGLSLLFLIIVLFTLALSSYMLDWFQSYRSLVIALIGWILFFIIASLIIFVKADYFDNHKKMMTAAKVSVAGLLIIASLQMAFAFVDLKMPPGTPCPWNIAVNAKGDMAYQIYRDDRHSESSGSHFFPATSLWLMKEPGHKIVSIQSSTIASFDFTPAGDIDYTVVRNNQILGHFISPEATVEFWRSDMRGENRRRLYSTVINIRDWHIITSAYSGDRTLLFIPDKDTNREGSPTLVILSASGSVERTFPLPCYISGDRGIFLRELGGALYIQTRPYSTGRTEGNHEFGALYRFNIETGAVETLYDLNKKTPPSTIANSTQKGRDSAKAPRQMEVVSHIVTEPDLISPSGTLQLLRRSLRNDKDHVRDELYLIDLKKGGHEELITAIPGYIRNMSWLNGKDTFTYSCRYDKDMPDTSAQVIQYDAETQCKKALFTSARGELLYPIRAQFYSFLDFGDYAGVDGRIHPKQAEKYLLHLFNKETKTMRLILLNLADGSHTTLMEGEGIGYAALSPDLTQFAYFKNDRTLPPFHDKYRGDSSLWIKDISTGESQKVQDYPGEEILFHRPQNVDIIWRTDEELMVILEPAKIISVTEKGRSVKQVYP